MRLNLDRFHNSVHRSLMVAAVLSAGLVGLAFASTGQRSEDGGVAANGRMSTTTARTPESFARSTTSTVSTTTAVPPMPSTTPTTLAPTTTTTTAPPTTTTTIAIQALVSAPAAPAGCDPNYSGCVPIDSDVDCAGGSGNGPSYIRGPVNVIGRDIYGLDGNDNDGIGCE